MSELALANIINVSIQGSPKGISERNVNSLAMFTTEKPSGVDQFAEHLDARTVGLAYGTNSVAYQMAVAIFSQSPNILSGRGKLLTIPYTDAVSATSGNFVTASLTANLAGIIAVTSGDLKVTLNQVAINLTGLDFSNCTTIAHVAQVLQIALVNVIVTASDTAITFTSKKVGIDADVVLAQLTGGAGTDLSGAGLFNTSAGTPTSGTSASGETLAEAISRTEGLVDFVGIITDLEMEDTAVVTASNAVQAMDKIFLHHFASSEDVAEIITDISDASNYKTRCLLYMDDKASANLMKSAYAGRAFSVVYSGSNTAQTMHLKDLSTIPSDPNMTQTVYPLALDAGADMYVNMFGVAKAICSGANMFFDEVYGNLALKFALETAGFNYLAQTNTKVPQTEAGMDGLKGAYNKVLERFVRNRYIGTGLIWNSSETFGNPEDFKRNITERGYFTYSIPIALQAQTERELRKAPLAQIAVKRAGAIHSSDVIVVIES